MLGLGSLRAPVLAVVGSKGKATIATYASALLAAAGLRVGTLTSPPIITNAERVRVGGRALTLVEYEVLSGKLAAALGALPAREAHGGYLAPTGLYTLMGVRHMADAGCDVLVLEAGIGGASDEISLFPASVVVAGRIFGEHLGLLGDTVAEIAAEKIGVAGPQTKRVLSLPQSLEVEKVLRGRLARSGLSLEIVSERGGGIGGAAGASLLSAMNAALGCRAALAMLEILGRPAPRPESVDSVLSSVRLPGRLSRHVDATGRIWVVDAAINGAGAAAALEFCDRAGIAPQLTLVCIPDGKDAAGVRDALEGRPYVPVTIATEHLAFREASWPAPPIPFGEIDPKLPDRRVLCLGTWSFAAEVLDRLGVDCATSFVTATRHR